MNNKNEASCPKRGRVGGQAVIEGIMMRGTEYYTTAVRTSDGNIVTDTHKNASVKDKHKFLGLPIIRGIVNYIEMMILAFSTLDFAANALGIEEEPSKFDKWLEKHFGKSLMTIVTVIGAILGVGLSLFLFIYIPALISDLTFNDDSLYFVQRLFEGVIKILIFVAYISLISLMPDIKRTFRYHGAEHKSIFCFEKGLPLTVDNIKTQIRFHPRCGTSFLIVMMIIGIVVSSLFKIDNRLFYVLYKILTLPVLVGLGYEVIIFAGKHDNFIVRILTAPGLWMQRLTTAEPDDSMIEVAIVALKSALPDVFKPEEVFEGIKLPDKNTPDALVQPAAAEAPLPESSENAESLNNSDNSSSSDK